MKKILVTVEFFRRYWPEIRRCAVLTVELWSELMKLAPRLAQELREADDAGL